MSENALACAMNTTFEGGMYYNVIYLHDQHITNYFNHAVPGPPVTLMAEPSLQDCTQAILRWSPPAPDEQNGNNLVD
jgi:hypothetical protein